MAAEPKKATTPRKKRAPRKPKAPAFEAYVANSGEKPYMSPENQEYFHNWYSSLPGTHQGTVRVFLSMMVNAPMLADGYKKQATTWRRFLIDRPAEVSF